MTVRNSRSLVALFLSVILMLSFFTVNAFAAEESVSEQQSETVTEANSEDATAAETENESGSDAETTTAGEETTTGADTEKKDSNLTELIVNLVIGGVIIIIAAVLIIKNRVKLGLFLRSVKNELHKIIWSPKEQTRKNFLVVIVICLSVAILVGLLDFAFSKGIIGLASLFS